MNVVTRALRSKLVAVPLWLLFTATWQPHGAAASPGDASAADVAQARVHYSHGQALQGEGKYAEARAEIERAYEAAPTYRVLYELALACEGQGDRTAAIHYVRRYLEEGKPDLDDDQRARGEGLLARLRARVALVTIRSHPSGDAGVAVDEEPFGEVSATPLVLLPGARKIWVTRAGYYPWEQTVLVKEGDEIELIADLKELPRNATARQPSLARSWYALAALLLAVAIGLIASVAHRRKRVARRAPLDNVNAYRAAEDTKPPQPTSAQVNVIVVDAEAPDGETPLVVAADAATDVGRVKPTNEDSHLLEHPVGLFAVADGIGGFAGGAIASRTAVETIRAYFAGKPEVGALADLPEPAARLVNAVYAANAAIRREQAATPNLADMGTTCVAAQFASGGRDLFLVHVGDSRAYRLRGGRLEQLTTDHTMAEFGVTGRRAQHLSRALGSEAAPKLDVLVLHPKADDVYVLCCDGLTKMLSDDDLLATLRSGGSTTESALALVAKANAAGGLDNITAIVLKLSHSR